MFSAICFKMDQSKILSSGNGVNPWVNPALEQPFQEEGFWKHRGKKGENDGTSIRSFFSTTIFCILT